MNCELCNERTATTQVAEYVQGKRSAYAPVDVCTTCAVNGTRGHCIVKYHFTHESLVANIEKVYAVADKQDVFEGLSWYAVALSDCAVVSHETQTDVRTVAAVVAALSPQIPWARNVKLARACIIAHASGLPLSGHTRNQLDKVRAILAGADHASTIKGKSGYKTASFYQNILGYGDAVTIDRHAIGVAHNTVYGDKVPNLTEKEYNRVADAYRTVARAHGIDASQVQAITWLAWRRIKGIETAYGR